MNPRHETGHATGHQTGQGHDQRAAELVAMRRAIELAALGLGRTTPNPVVGCVVLDRDGRVVGEGFHERAGGPHAEVVALAQAGAAARGGTAVVTLEPCRHTGRTGPCTQALREAGIARVVAAVADPDPTAAGGLAELRAAGVDTELGLLAEPAERVNEHWLTALRLRRPHVTWKLAATLDGRVAARDGSSRWITSEAARADAHRLRAQLDAVLVGSGTARADDPALTVRHAELTHGAPLRVVIDSAAGLPPTARVFDHAAPTLLAVAEDTPADHVPGHVEVLRLPRAGGAGVDLPALLAALHARQVRSVLLEGGPVLAGAFLSAGLVDTVVAYLAPVLLGGGGLAALEGLGAASIDQAWRVRLDDVRRVGDDVRLTARFTHPGPPASPAPPLPLPDHTPWSR